MLTKELSPSQQKNTLQPILIPIKFKNGAINYISGGAVLEEFNHANNKQNVYILDYYYT